MDDALPALIKTENGYTLEYKNKFLYSRYNPQKNAHLSAQKTSILNETLILCPSPLLGYGLSILLQKVPESSLILGLESDEKLMKLSISSIENSILTHPQFYYVRTNSIDLLLQELQDLKLWPFRRCVRLDLSGGAQLDEYFYSKSFEAIQNHISFFWKNRLTLISLGRNYARNIFRNLPKLSTAKELVPQSIEKPILVLGAGPSLDAELSFIVQYRRFFFLLVVDTAFSIVEQAGIIPDAVVLVESQYWIESSFVGLQKYSIPIFADLTARTNVLKKNYFSDDFQNYFAFFFTNYTDSHFTKKLLTKDFLPIQIPPLGSVGLSALYLARQLARPDMPIFICGLDFAYTNSFSHSKITTPIQKLYANHNRLQPLASFWPGLNESSKKIITDKSCYNSDPALMHYAEIARSFSEKKIFFNCYNLSTSGMDLGIPSCTEKDASQILETVTAMAPTNFSFLESKKSSEVKKFLEQELRNLILVKELLTTKQEKSTHDLMTKLRELITELDYVFIHFPDGHKGFSEDLNFLNRVRIEIEYFIKTLNNALKDF